MWRVVDFEGAIGRKGFLLGPDNSVAFVTPLRDESQDVPDDTSLSFLGIIDLPLNRGVHIYAAHDLVASAALLLAFFQPPEGAWRPLFDGDDFDSICALVPRTRHVVINGGESARLHQKVDYCFDAIRMLPSGILQGQSTAPPPVVDPFEIVIQRTDSAAADVELRLFAFSLGGAIFDYEGATGASDAVARPTLDTVPAFSFHRAAYRHDVPYKAYTGNNENGFLLGDVLKEAKVRSADFAKQFFTLRSGPSSLTEQLRVTFWTPQAVDPAP